MSIFVLTPFPEKVEKSSGQPTSRPPAGAKESECPPVWLSRTSSSSASRIPFGLLPIKGVSTNEEDHSCGACVRRACERGRMCRRRKRQGQSSASGRRARHHEGLNLVWRLRAP